MTTALVLDAGALIALDRNERGVWAMLRVAADSGSVVQVPAGAIGQAWRDGRRQVLLSRALRHCDEVSLDGLIAHVEDVVILTSDPGDIRRLVSALGVDLRLEAV